MNEPFEPSADDSSDPDAGRGHQGLPKATIMVSFVTILTAGAATFLGMQWSGTRADSKLLSQELDEVTAQETEISTELGDLSSQLANIQQQADVLGAGPLVFCNNSDEKVTIKHLAATYLNSAEEFETFTTEEYGEDIWEIPPRTRMKLDFGRGAIWDGSVTYYSLILEVKNDDDEMEQIPFSGFWKSEQTECVQSWPAG